MNARDLRLASLLIVVVALLFVTGCEEGDRVGELQTKSESIEYSDAGPVLVDIEMGAGELGVSGGASELLEATYTYNVDELNPVAAFDEGKVTISHSDIDEGFGTLFDMDDYRNEWELLFREDVPMEMRIDLGAGRTDLNLGSLALTALDVDAGAAEVNLDLGGSQILQSLDLDVGTGAVTLDLSGDWQEDLEAQIRGGVGNLKLKLPQATGVHIEVDAGIGGVDSSGLSKNGNIYTNDAFGESNVELLIEINGGVGHIELDGS